MTRTDSQAFVGTLKNWELFEKNLGEKTALSCMNIWRVRNKKVGEVKCELIFFLKAGGIWKVPVRIE